MWHNTVIVLFRDKTSTNLVEIRLLSEDLCFLSVPQVLSISFLTFSYFGEVYTPLSGRKGTSRHVASKQNPTDVETPTEIQRHRPWKLGLAAAEENFERNGPLLKV
jgi:hypothetical protein